MLTLIAADEQSSSSSTGSSPTPPISSPSSNNLPVGSPKSTGTATTTTTASTATGDVPIRFNPYLSKQSPTVASKISLDTLGLPPLSNTTAKEICKLYEEHKEPSKLLSSFVHLCYFHSLILQKKYDLVFVSGTKIGSNSILKSYPFANVLEGMMNEIVTGKFMKFLERLLNKEGNNKSGSSQQQPIGSNLSKLQAASLTILNMLFNMDYIPEKLNLILSRYLKEFHEELRRTLNEIRNNPSYVPSTSYSSSKADCKAKVEVILGQIGRIKSHSKLVGEPHCVEQVVEFQNMLKRFSVE